MLRINSVFILRKSVNYRVNLFSKRNMNSTILSLGRDRFRFRFNDMIACSVKDDIFVTASRP